MNRTGLVNYRGAPEKGGIFCLFEGFFRQYTVEKTKKKKNRGAPAKQRVKLPMNSKMCLALQK